MKPVREQITEAVLWGAVILVISLATTWAQAQLMSEGGGDGLAHKVRWRIAEHERQDRERREYERLKAQVQWEAWLCLNGGCADVA